jgi:hypothetical protein
MRHGAFAAAVAVAALLTGGLTGCAPSAPTPTADRTGARVGQLAVALAANTQGVWQELVVSPSGCELGEDSHGVRWSVNAIQRDSTYPFNREDETVEELAESLAEHWGKYGYETVATVERQAGDQMQVVIAGSSTDIHLEHIEFQYSFYPDDPVSALIHIRSECLPGDPDDYPHP